MNIKSYTNEELAYIKRFYSTCGTDLIAKELGFTEARVRKIAFYHGFKKKVSRSKKAPKPFVTSKKIPRNLNPISKYITIPNPQPSDYIHGGRYAEELEKCGYIVARDSDGNLPEIKPGGIYPVTIKPRKNWLQRLVSWLLTGEV